MFGISWRWTHARLTRLLYFLVIVAVLISIGGYIWWDKIGPWLKENENSLKIVSYVIGPLLAFIGFVAGTKDKLELQDQATRLQRQKDKATLAKAAARDALEQARLARADADRKAQEANKLTADIKRITEGADELWKVRSATPFADYATLIGARKGATIITVGNLKGGVGKTTVAANLAAYICATKKRPVLLIDLDFQASLTNMMLLAIEEIGAPEVEGQSKTIENLLTETAGLNDVWRNQIHLLPKLDQAWIIPSNYHLSKRENKLLLDLLMQNDTTVDIRYRLANVLLRPEVREKYAAIILDMPPRMSVAAVNALVASHYFLVPTQLNRQSTEAVSQFLSMMSAIKKDMGLDLELLGVLANMTNNPGSVSRDEHGEVQSTDLTGIERSEAARAFEAVDAAWKYKPRWSEVFGAQYMLSNTFAKRVAVANAAGVDIAYIQATAAARQVVHTIFDPVAGEICRRIGIE